MLYIPTVIKLFEYIKTINLLNIKIQKGWWYLIQTSPPKCTLDKIKILSGAQLKYIAFVSMLIDHVNKALIYPNLNGEGLLLKISNLFDVLGRIAFPIFAFLLVEGFFNTKNRKNYLLYLLGFAIISEVPFDLFVTKTFFNPRFNNVLFSLSLALITIWIIDIIKTKIKKSPRIIWYTISLFIVTIMCFISMFLSVDYDYHAILIVYFFYIFYNKPILSSIFGYLSIFKEVWATLGFGFILTYNGKRGKQSKILNYCFYPVHLLILGLLRMYFNI